MRAEAEHINDSYLEFANSMLGGRITGLLGLPQPAPLERFQAGEPVIKGPVLIGAGGEPELLAPLADVLGRIGAQTLAHRSLPQWTALANANGMLTGRWGGEDGENGGGVRLHHVLATTTWSTPR